MLFRSYAVDATLTDTKSWYLDYVGANIKAFVKQTRKAPTFVPMENPEAETVFLRKQFLYSVEARYNVGFGFWQYSIKIHNT